MSQDPSRFIARHVIGLPRSGIRDFFELVAGMKDVISLGIGEPDFSTPWHIREAAIYSLEKGRTFYTSNLGLIELRREISKYIGRNFGIEYDASSEVLVAVGVSEAMDIALRAVLNPGDKVMYQDPCFVSYHPTVMLSHGVGVSIKTDAKSAFTIKAEEVKKAWEPGCKVLMINLPCNPTGGVAEKAELEEIARFAIEKDMLVISDEIYAELTYEGEHVSIASLPGMQERTIFLHGFSKAWAMTGWRLGYACAPSHLIEAMMKVHQYSMMCASIIAQDAGIEALRNGDDAVQKMKVSYKRRRDLVLRRFNEMGLACHKPNATFYAFPNITSTGMSSVEFAKALLEDEKVAMVPGTAFGEYGEGFVRCSFATGYDQLVEACNRIERFVKNHTS
ncbi:aminotransferase class I/II-fold pyridoxal phosphate-dependent enzyme [Puniceicoccaceae bacterium K14]|nr:aminotransferase class I/II-fold pyridoxal phosphate-dependent enzyme [Puniceicoccaceae bacterium K14]